MGAWRARTEEHERGRAAALRRGPLSHRAFGKLEGPALVRTKADFDEFARESDFDLVNGIGAKAYGQRWLAGAAKLAPFGGRRNHEIVERCVAVMEAHRGRRLVVVIGAGHKAVLDEIFRRRGDVRVLAWENYVRPPTEAGAAPHPTSSARYCLPSMA